MSIHLEDEDREPYPEGASWGGGFLILPEMHLGIPFNFLVKSDKIKRGRSEEPCR